jgi:NADH dehydrogenase FAD-containing subunit
MSSATESDERVDVLVLGASFAGIELALQLARRSEAKPLRTVVVDRQAEHGYIPLVHERLCGRLDPARATLDTRAFVDSLPATRFVHDEVVGLDVSAKTAELASGKTISARFVVVALGSTLHPPDLPGAERLRSHKDGTAFDDAVRTLDATLREHDAASVVVVGAGITGVELAAELADLHRQRPSGWNAPRVTLVGSSATLLPELAPGVGRKAARVLEALQVDVRLGARLEAMHEEAATVRESPTGGAPQTVEVLCDLAFWTGGVRPMPILAQLGLPRTDAGWLAVGPTLQCFPADPEQPDIFACGDAVRVMGGEGQWPTMQRAIECLWQAKVVARNIATLAAEPADYPRGVPPLHPHRLREDFYYGVSLGPRSLIVRGRLVVDLPGVNHWFRRWLMRQYFARYAPL